MSVPWYLMARGKGEGGYKTASGPIVSVNDALAAPLRSLSIGIDPVQDLHGYDSPWPSGGGKNKWNVPYSEPVTLSKVYTFDSPLPIGTYTVSYISADHVPTAQTFQFGYYKDTSASYEYTNISSNSKARTFTTTEPCSKIVLYSDKAYTESVGITTTFVGLMLESGSTATTYAPYSNLCPISGWSAANVWVKPTYDPTANPTATIQLGQTVYGGTLDVTNGVLTVDRAMVLASTLSWTLSGTDSFYATKTDKQRGLNTAICTHFSSRTYTSSDRILIENTGITSKDDLYAYFGTQEAASTPVQLVYTLATPITIPLTPTQISTLQGANNVWADCGPVDVEYLASGGANADLMKLAVAFMGRK